jgi:hypothetical protein
MHRTSALPVVRLLAAAAVLLLLSGCDKIPGLGPDPRVAQREEESKAIGGACRHALRGLEDCYTLNPKASKAAIFAGWKEMDAYMRENKLDGTPAVLGQADKSAREKPARAEANETESRSSGAGRKGS